MKLTPLLAALMLAAAMAFAACGDDEDDGGGGEAAASSVTITASGGKLSVEGSPRPGVTEITLRNEDKGEVAAQLVRITGDHSEAEVKRVYDSSGEGKPIPEWLRAEGGVGTTRPGQSATVTQDLPEGTYYAANDEAENTAFAKFEVTGEESDAELPETDAVVTAEEYSFETSGLKAGTQTIAFENAGKEPHHVLALPLQRGKSIADFKRFIQQDNQGQPPVNFERGATSTVIDGDKSIVQEVALQKGDYVLVCFISDRKGGPPHAVKGMISPATVE